MSKAHNTHPSVIDMIKCAAEITGGETVQSSGVKIEIPDPISFVVREGPLITELNVSAAPGALIHVGRTLNASPKHPDITRGNGVSVAFAAIHGNCVHENLSAEPRDPSEVYDPKIAVVGVPRREYLPLIISVVGCFNVLDSVPVKEPVEKAVRKTLLEVPVMVEY